MATKTWVGTSTTGDWSVAANWSPAAVPENGDDVVLENSSQSVTAGFAQSAVTLASLKIAQSFLGQVGDDDNYLAISATVLDIGHNYGPGTPAGSGRIKIDLGSVQSAGTIYNSGQAVTAGMPAILIKGTHASNTLDHRKGSVGIAFLTGETATFTTINVGYVNQVSSDADLYIGSGVTLATLAMDGGDTVQRCAATTVTQKAGSLITEGSGAITTVNCRGGTMVSNSTGTITTLNIADGTGHVDFTKSRNARTVTTVKLEAGGSLSLDPDVVTLTNKVDSDLPVKLTAIAA